MYEKLLSLLFRFFEAEKSIKKGYEDKSYELIDEYSISELHSIDYIGKTQYPNVTKMSEKLNMTKGGISKIIRKLIKKGSIESYSLNTNKKEIYYKLTELGKLIFEKHQVIHNNWCEKNIKFFKKLNDDEIKNTISFLEKYINYLDSIK